MIPMVDLKRQYYNLKTEIDAAVGDVLEQAQFILGPNVSKLEEEVAAYHGLPYAVGVANGTDALLLALRACGGISAMVMLIRRMRSTSTASASRKMLESACPAICAREG